MTKAETDKQLRSAIVDEYGALVSQIAPWKQNLTRVEELAKIIRGWYAEKNGEEFFVETGARYQATLGVKQLQTRIDVPGAWKALGRKLFLQVATVTQKALEANLPVDALSALLAKERTGSRPLLVSLLPESPMTAPVLTDVR